MSIISLVVATDEEGVIGKDNKLPWHMPADLRFFRDTTMGHPVIMGRKTFQSMGKPLKGRKNIVITRQHGLQLHEDVAIAGSLEEAISLAGNSDEIFVIGGSEIFRTALPVTHRIYHTLIHHRFDGDTYFQVPSGNDWNRDLISEHQPDEKNPYPYSFWLISRKSG